MEHPKWDLERVSKVVSLVVALVSIYLGTMVHLTTQRWQESTLITSLIEPLSSANLEQQLIATEVAMLYASRGMLPKQLWETLWRLRTHATNAKIARNAQRAVEYALRNNREAFQQLKPNFAGVVPQVYFHIPREDLRTFARAVEDALEANLADIGLVVPSIELIKLSPNETQLRYFKADDAEEANKIGSALLAAGINARVVDFSRDYGHRKDIPLRHYELWIGIRHGQ